MLSRRLLRIKVIKALYTHFKSETSTLNVSEKNMLFSVNKCYELYLQMLALAVDVADHAASKIELGRRKMLPTEADLNPNMRFVENQAVAKIRSSEGLYDALEIHSLGWSQYPELIKKLYNELEASDFYKEYMEAADSSFDLDVKLLEEFFINIVQDNEAVETVVEEQSIMWMDDIDFALVLVVRTLQNMKVSRPLSLLPQYKNGDDRNFVKTLFRSAILNNTEYFNYIDQFTKNWDMDRIAFMDRLIMLAALSEVTSFPDIPVKVSMDEYIEISKYYSTPDSSTFINGVLDKIVEHLQSENKVVKTGRGLI